jgi:hypothetical protein
MKSVAENELKTFLCESQIQCADPSTGIGRELSYATGPQRLIVIYCGESVSSEYREAVFRKVIALDETWLLTARYGSVPTLGKTESEHDVAAVQVDRQDKEQLVEFLCRHFEAIQTMDGEDLYLVAGTGLCKVTYDHHTPEEGLSVYLNDIEKAEQLLIGLNEIGAELELYSVNEKVT